MEIHGHKPNRLNKLDKFKEYIYKTSNLFF